MTNREIEIGDREVEDDFLLNEIRAIPEVEAEIEKNAVGSSFLLLAVAYVIPQLATYFKERSYASQAIEVIRDIRAKYASIEFLLKNYMD